MVDWSIPILFVTSVVAVNSESVVCVSRVKTQLLEHDMAVQFDERASGCIEVWSDQHIPDQRREMHLLGEIEWSGSEGDIWFKINEDEVDYLHADEIAALNNKMQELCHGTHSSV